jgi:hypothetical protein
VLVLVHPPPTSRDIYPRVKGVIETARIQPERVTEESTEFIEASMC